MRHALYRSISRRAVAAVALVAALVPWAASAAGESQPLVVRNASISGNWAGYAASISGVTSVTGTWVVPNAGTLPPGVSSTWAGIGGFTTSDLIQAGTQQVSSPLDNFIAGGAYGAWYELLPANPVFFSGCKNDPACTVHPGDTMTTTITNAGGNNWSISMADIGHWTFSITVPYASSESSAEWIHESPSLAGVLPVPVGNSGTVTFDGTNTETSGAGTASISGSGASSLIALPVETATSSLDTDGDGFNVCTYALSCSASGS